MDKLDKVYNYTVTFTLAVEVRAVDEYDAVNQARWFAMNNGAEYEDHKISLQGVASAEDAADYYINKWSNGEETWAEETGHEFAQAEDVWVRPDGSTCADIWSDFLAFVARCQENVYWDEHDATGPSSEIVKLNNMFPR